MLEEIKNITGDALLDIANDTLTRGKQLIVFVNTKKGAEATAERLISVCEEKLDAKELEELKILSEKALHTLNSPTKQCRRLGKVISKGVAFHHAGLHSKQREIVEDNFKSRHIKIICATPTLAAGVDLPAFRVIIRDLKRFGGGWGMTSIPVLEYSQMAGRAGRPSYDTTGQAICIASTPEEKEEIWSEYINGEPEDILSKLAVEPVLRTYILSLVATGYVRSLNGLKEFMKKTFYAHQYKDLSRLMIIINKMVEKLDEWEFITTNSKKNEDFQSGKDYEEELNQTLKATKLGERVAELYLDPYTAHYLLSCLQKAASKKNISDFSYSQMISHTLEMRPLIRARKKDLEDIEEKMVSEESNLISPLVDEYSDEYEEYLDSFKTAIVFEEWMDETTEELLLEKFNVSPGELNMKLDRADWLVYACYELTKIQNFRDVGRQLLKLRVRLKNGVKEELLALLKLKGIGRIRARKLFANGIKTLGDVKKKDISSLATLLGKKIAIDIKKQVGQEFSEEKIVVKKNKRKSQISLNDF